METYQKPPQGLTASAHVDVNIKQTLFTDVSKNACGERTKTAGRVLRKRKSRILHFYLLQSVDKEQ